MIEERYIEAKEELLRIMNDGTHCNESIDAVKECKCAEDLMRTLNQYCSQVVNKDFPPYYFIKKWFGDDVKLLNQLGIYIDQNAIFDGDNTNIYIYGKSAITAKLKGNKRYYIHVYNYSNVNLVMDELTHAVVVLHHRSKCSYTEAKYSRVTIKKPKKNENPKY